MGAFRDFARAASFIVFLLCLFELGLRLSGAKYESSFYESDPVLYTALRPNSQGWQAKEGESFIRINTFGMRDRERTLTPAAGVTRIALLGDSLVAAEEVPLEKTAGQVLEATLQNELGPNHPVEVLNFGVGGYTLSQEFLQLRERVWSFRPDVVVLILSPSMVPSCDRHLYTVNVPFFVLRDGELVPDPKNHPILETSQSRRWHAFGGDLMNHVRLFQMIRKATQDGIPQEVAKLEGKKKLRNDNILDMWLRAPTSSAQENAWQVADGILSAMASDARHHSTEFYISAIGPEIEENPNLEQRQEFLLKQGISEISYAEKRFQTMADAHGIKFVAIEPQMLNYAENNRVSLRGFFNTRPNFGHWNEIGNAAAANILADSLLRNSHIFVEGVRPGPDRVAQMRSGQ